MKKEQKTKITKERIMQAAMEEFGTNGYAASTLNAICGGHGIAKGLLYHNFKGKDELYLSCVSRCFLDVTEYLKAQNIQNNLKKYMELRLRYFSEHPLCARIFFEAVLQPPTALAEQIRVRKAEFDEFNRRIYKASLSQITLRKGITEKEAIKYYEVMQEMFNGYFSSTAYAGKNFQTLVADHEDWLAKMLDFMLFGIGERNTRI